MSVKRLVSLNTVSLATDPANPRIGDLYLNSVTDKVRVYTNSGWIEVGAGSSGSAVSIGTTAPTTPSPNEGDLWYNNVDPHFYTYDGTYWVEISFGPVGPSGPGLATGGTTGQIAAKSSNADYDTTWVNPYTDVNAKDAVGNAVGSGLSYNTTTKAISVNTSVIASQAYVDNAVSSLSSTSDETYVPNSSVGNPDGVATLDEFGNVPISQLGNIIDGAPEVLDTLNELAAAIGDDADFITNITNSVYDTEIGIIMGAY
jgi:hypothetical protein